MHKPIKGKDKILMFRLLSKAAQEGAAKLGLQIEHSWSYNRATDFTQTKDGAVASSGGLEVALNIQAVSSLDDPVNDMLFEAVKTGEKLEVWEINLADEQSDGKYGALYAQGNLESWETPSNVEDLEQFTTSMKIDGVPQEGVATLTAQQEAAIAYAFRDTAKVDS